MFKTNIHDLDESSLQNIMYIVKYYVIYIVCTHKILNSSLLHMI